MRFMPKVSSLRGAIWELGAGEDLFRIESDVHVIKMPGGLYINPIIPLVGSTQHLQGGRDIWG